MMTTTHKFAAVAIELGKEDTEYNEHILKGNKKNGKPKKDNRCKRFVIQTMTMLSRFSSLFDLITDGILLYKASSRNVIQLTLVLSLSIVSPYVLSYSSGIKLFIYRKTFDNLVGFRNLFLILYLLPTSARIDPKVRKSDIEKKDNDVDEEAEEVEEAPRSEQKDERKQEEYAADDEAEWHTRVIGMCIAQKYEYNTACNIIRCKLNCILMERLASAQRHHKLIHWMYECLYECKQAQNNKTMKNVHSFLSKCTNPKIAQFAKRFKANNDLEALSTSMQHLLHEDYADIADFGPGGTMSHYFSALMDHYTHGGVQDIIKQIKRDELALVDGKVNKYMKNYPFIEESEDNADRSEKIKPRSQWMHRMLLDNGADVNFPCLNGGNDNQVVVSPLGICLTQFFDSLDHLDIIQDLLNRQAKLTQAEIPMLSELFVKASSQKADAIDMYCDVLENIAKNSNVLLQNVTDLDDNNPIHTAVIHHHAFNQNKDACCTRE
eukprot:749714_1